jgi:hypothetical protein
MIAHLALAIVATTLALPAAGDLEASAMFAPQRAAACRATLNSERGEAKA